MKLLNVGGKNIPSFLREDNKCNGSMGLKMEGKKKAFKKIRQREQQIGRKFIAELKKRKDKTEKTRK
jgi:hypothetical protein